MTRRLCVAVLKLVDLYLIMDKLFELFGVIYGDGHVHTTENRITITGSLEDFYYYSYYLKPLILSLFNVNVNIRKDKVKNSYRLVFENKSVSCSTCCFVGILLLGWASIYCLFIPILLLL